VSNFSEGALLFALGEVAHGDRRGHRSSRSGSPIAADYRAMPADAKELRALHESAIVGTWTS
jgi:hypothetical protein